MSKEDVQKAIDEETEASTVSLQAIARVDEDDIDPEQEADDYKRQVVFVWLSEAIYLLLTLCVFFCIIASTIYKNPIETTQGNNAFKKGLEYRRAALKLFTKAITLPVKNHAKRSVYFSNRAAVNLASENYGNCISDWLALLLLPTFRLLFWFYALVLEYRIFFFLSRFVFFVLFSLLLFLLICLILCCVLSFYSFFYCMSLSICLLILLIRFVFFGIHL